jgi:hypothetical protein
MVVATNAVFGNGDYPPDYLGGGWSANQEQAALTG